MEQRLSLPMESPKRPKSEAGGFLALLEESAAFLPDLHELRHRLILVGAALIAATVWGWFLAPKVLLIFEQSVDRLIFVSPAEALISRLRIAVSIGLILSLPVGLWQLWRFVMPGLFPEERSALLVLMWVGGLLFFGGLLFGYFLVYPVALRFFMGFGAEGLRPAIVVSRHLSFFMGTTLTFGFAFQLPTALLVLVRVGLLTTEQLRAWRRHALFLAFVVGAALTPADVFSQLMMAIPLAILYEATLWFAPRFERKARRADRGDAG